MIDNVGKDLKFPEGFLWGTATSAHQVEGNNHNDWAEWEKSERRINYLKSKGLNPENYISGIACDHYNHYEEDFDLAKAMNNNAHRFSIEWSRIEPEEGKFNRAEIEHYRKVICALKGRGIEPFVTLWHWTMPVWFVKKGGFEKRENIKYFIRFCERMAKEFSSEVKFWIVLNEPMVYAGMSYFRGDFPPQKKSFFASLWVVNNLARAHNLVFKVIHDIDKKAMVGITASANYFQGWMAPAMSWVWIFRFYNKIKNHQDFIGLNYYYRRLVKGFYFDIGENSRSDMNWEIYPKGIYYVLKNLSRYKKPLYIIENGLADAQDKYRAKFVIDHLKWIHKAISEGIDVRGYFHWSLLDNFEWAYGFWPRFGLVEIDYSAKGGSASGGKTLERKPRPSSWIYAEIAKANAIGKRL